MQKAKCTHDPIPSQNELDYDPVFDIPCFFDKQCHICKSLGVEKFYCQYEIYSPCGICGRDICNNHVALDDHLTVCVSCHH
jgi:hypothetical protein